ncbi:putative EH-domain containing protein [Balamuthia mandrillaris]
MFWRKSSNSVEKQSEPTNNAAGGTSSVRRRKNRNKGNNNNNNTASPVAKKTDPSQPPAQQPPPKEKEQVDPTTATVVNDSGEGRTTSITTLLEDTMQQVNNIYRDIIDVVGANFKFRTPPSKGEIFSPPMVVFLGNHSSGKSTFINYLLDEIELQTTGQAPMDDGFTLICYGKNRDEQLGPAIVNNTKLPYTSLSNIGEQFVEHLKMKFLPHPLLKDVTLVDSPGMIDSVGEEGRGYDFQGAVRWFAQRADYVLFFFDGEKPGTTGETLKVFTESLTGIDHKLLILMNKVDTFRNIGDFVRTYGTLCWNLAKVIPYKDMPFIYTTFVPQNHLNDGDDSRSRMAIHSRSPSPTRKNSKNNKGDSTTTPGSVKESSTQHNSYGSWSLAEFEKARRKIVKKVMSAPSRHADNMITELRKHTEHLLIHSQVISAARNKLWYTRLQYWVLLFLFCLFSAAFSFQFGLVVKGTPLPSLRLVDDILYDPTLFFFPVMLALASLWIGLSFIIPMRLRIRETELISNLGSIFEEVFSKELMSTRDEYYKSLWKTVAPTTEYCATKFGLLSLPSLKRTEKQRLEAILATEVEAMLHRVHTTLQQ